MRSSGGRVLVVDDHPVNREVLVRQLELLGIPADVETAALIPLGYPLGKFGRPPRRPLRDVAFADSWGQVF